MSGSMVMRWFRRPRALALPAPGAYALWARDYPPAAHNPLMRLEQEILEPLIHACSPGVALDAGTGTGRYVPVLRAAGARFVAGLDLSEEMLSRNFSVAERVRGHACRLPFTDRSFDLVCASLMAGDLSNLAAWLQEASRVLVAGGHLVYSDFHPEWSRRGWRRTFSTPEAGTVELPYVPHSVDEHLDGARAAGLSVRAIREPRLDGGQPPLLLILHFQKPGPAGRARRSTQ